jgi:hypothetical protein
MSFTNIFLFSLIFTTSAGKKYFEFIVFYINSYSNNSGLKALWAYQSFIW